MGFSKKDRDTNIRRVGFVANLLSRNGVVKIVATISPYREIRDEIRDVKGLYAKARAGEIKGFTGIDEPYEPPLNAEIVCNTNQETLEESVSKVIMYLQDNGFLSTVTG